MTLHFAESIATRTAFNASSTLTHYGAYFGFRLSLPSSAKLNREIVDAHLRQMTHKQKLLGIICLLQNRGDVVTARD